MQNFIKKINVKKVTIAILFLCCFFGVTGISWSYFNTIVEGNDDAKVYEANTANLSLLYTDSSEITLDNAMPGDSVTKTFTVKNTGDVKTTYDIKWAELLNAFADRTDLVYKLESTDNSTFYMTVPTSGKNVSIVDDIEIDPSETHSYTMTIYFKDLDEDQNDNQGKKVSGKLIISEERYEDATGQAYTVKYDSNGGSGEMEDSSHIYGTESSLTKNTFTKTNYAFAGWSKNKDAVNATYSDEQAIESLSSSKKDEITLYAVWADDSIVDIDYTIKYNANGGMIGEEMSFVDRNIDGLDTTNNFTYSNGIYKSNMKEFAGMLYSSSSMYLALGATETITVSTPTKIKFDWASAFSYDHEVVAILFQCENESCTYYDYADQVAASNNKKTNDESKLSWQTSQFEIEEAGTYMVAFEAITEGISSSYLENLYIKNVRYMPTAYTDMSNQTVNSLETNTFTKNIFSKKHYTFLGWSENKNATTATYEDEGMIPLLTRTDGDEVELFAIWEKDNYTANVTVQNGTITGTASKTTLYNTDATFSVSANEEGLISSIECTNNQTASLNNGVLTVSNISANTTCNVKFSEEITSLYSDGTLIINEQKEDHSSNLSEHGKIIKTYEPFDENNAYTFGEDPDTYELTTLWYKDAGKIKSVEIGKEIQPTSLDFWFCNLTGLETMDLTNLDTSNVTSASYTFYYAGYLADNVDYNLSGLDFSSLETFGDTFYSIGRNAKKVNLDVSNWDVSNIDNVSSLFSRVGYGSNEVTLNASGWNLESLTTLPDNLFYDLGEDAKKVSIDLSNWNISTIEEINCTFYGLNNEASNFKLNLSGWDFSNVSSYTCRGNGPFENTAYNATKWKVIIPSTTGDYTNTVDELYMGDGVAATTPDSSKKYTLDTVLSQTYTVSVTVQNGTITGDTQKTVEYAQNATYTVNPTTVGDVGLVSCTNNQEAKVVDNTLTVSEVTSDTTCTVKYSGEATVLYADGTLIINEQGIDRTENIAEHGNIKNAYEPYGTDNSYEFEYDDTIDGITYPWYNEANEIKSVSVGKTISPTNMSFWFALLPYLENIDLDNIDTTNVTNFEGLFAETGYESQNIVLNANGWNLESVESFEAVFALIISDGKTNFTISANNWSSTSVTSLEYVFGGAGYNAQNVRISATGWDFPNVTSLVESFIAIGQNAETVDVNLSGWNISNVTELHDTFSSMGANSTSVKLNLVGWDFSNVEEYESVFEDLGISATKWKVIIPDTTGDNDNSPEKLYLSGENYLEPLSGRLFTLSSKLNESYTVNLLVQNGTISGDSSKSILYGNDASFITEPSNSAYIGSISCTNGQIGTIEDDVVTIQEVTDNTTCTVEYSATRTVIYEDGTLIINELFEDREDNAQEHGSVLRTFDRYSASNPYSASSEEEIPWYNYQYDITRVEVGDSIAPTNMDYWFYNLRYLSSVDLSNIDTSNVTSMNLMFYNASRYVNSDEIILFDISDWDFSSVSIFDDTFSDYVLYIIPDETGGIVNNSNLIYGIDTDTYGYGNFVIKSNYKENYEVNVTVTNGTVDGETTKIVNFLGGTTFDLIPTYEIGEPTVSCTNDQYAEVSENVLHVYELRADTTCTVSYPDSVTSLYEDGTLIINEKFSDQETNATKHGEIVDSIDAFVGPNDYLNNPFEDFVNDTISVEFGEVIKPTSTRNWFRYFSNLETIDFTNLDTSNITDMSYMFYETSCNSDTFDIGDLSDWDTSKVTNMEAMFWATGMNLENFSIVGLDDWDVSNVTDMSYMFREAGYYSSTVSIGDLSAWNVSNVTDMQYMFQSLGGQSESSLDVGNLDDWDVSKVTNMTEMFSGFGYLSSSFNIGDISDWNIGNVKNTSYMFSGFGAFADSWSELDLSKWDTSNVENMEGMFYYTAYSQDTFDIGDLSDWDTSNVTNMSRLFHQTAQEAKSFNVGKLTDWDTSKVTDMSSMFENAGGSANVSLDLSAWNFTTVTNMDDMFYGFGNKTNWMVIIPNTTGELVNTTEKLYGSSSEVYAEPRYNTTFTLASKKDEQYTVSLTAVNGTITGDATKTVSFSNDATFTVNPSTQGNKGFVECTNNQTATLSGSTLTVAFPTSSTSCTVSYYDSVSTFYEDGTIIINEDIAHRAANIQAHGNVRQEIKPYQDGDTTSPLEGFNYKRDTWNNYDIELVTVDKTIKPIDMSGWFERIGNEDYAKRALIEELDVSNIDTSNVTDMSYLFSGIRIYSIYWSNYYDYVSSVRKITGLENWDVSKVTNMSHMFSNNYFNTPIGDDIKYWNTSKVTDMTEMFAMLQYGEEETFEFDFTNWNLNKLKIIDRMFCMSGAEASSYVINFAGVEAPSLLSASAVFSGAASESTVTTSSIDISSFNFAGVTDLSVSGVAYNASNWSFKIPYKTGTLTNTTTKLYGKTSSIYSGPGYNRYFTLADDAEGEYSYDVSVNIKNGTVQGNASRTIAKGGNTTFDLVSSEENKLLVGTCTGGSNYQVSGNSVVVTDVYSSVTCDMSYEDTVTTLYSDKTLIINEDPAMRATNETNHGNIDTFYEPFSNANSYVFSYEEVYNEMDDDVDYILNTPWKEYQNSLIGIEVQTSIAPTSLQYWFRDYTKVSSLDISNIDTSNVTDMSYVFYNTGHDAASLSYDISDWNTSKVTNMTYMFAYSGNNNYSGLESTTWNVGNIGEWDTSKVTNMSYMFFNAGTKATTWSVGDLSDWDTGSVTDMSNMFYSNSSKSTSVSVGNLSDWNTSSVTNMSHMFAGFGSKISTTFNLGDLGEWDTSKVTNLSYMFESVGSHAATWNIGDLSDWDTSSATTMEGLFKYSGLHATSWSVGNLSEWDTSNVTNMGAMFMDAGMNSKQFNLGDLGEWDTSKVTDMGSMFAQGYDYYDDDIGVQSISGEHLDIDENNLSTIYIGDLSKWDTSNVISMVAMFSGFGTYSTSITMGDITGWDTSSVVSTWLMFQRAFQMLDTIDWDLSEWDMSNVQRTEAMFSGAFTNASSLKLNLSTWDLSNDLSMSGMFSLAAPNASTWQVIIPASTGSLINTTSTWYGKTSSYKATPASSKSFTIYSDATYTVSATITNGTITGDASRNVSQGASTTYNLTPTNENSILNVECSAGATTSINNNSVTVSNVQANITCVFAYESKTTVLYSDNTLIINEDYLDRDDNITEHGDVVKTYEPFGNSNSYPTRPWSDSDDIITRVEVGSEIKPTSFTNWFAYMPKLSYLDLNNLNIVNCTNLNSIFYEIGEIFNDDTESWEYVDSITIKMETWDTSNVTDMSYMFHALATGATTWDVGDLSDWDTSNVTRMDGMFSFAGLGDPNVNIGDLSDWNTSKVTSMKEMFQGFNSNASCNPVEMFSSWDTGEVTNLSSMFSSYKTTDNTVEADLSSMDFGKVTDMSNMFSYFDRVNGTNNKTIDISLSNSSTTSLTNLYSTFAEFSTSTNVTLDLTNLNTSNVTNMSYMFYYYGTTTSTVNLDLSGWDTSNVTNMSNMFKYYDNIPSSWTVVIPATTGSLSNTTTSFYGKTSSVYASPSGSYSFTLYGGGNDDEEEEEPEDEENVGLWIDGTSYEYDEGMTWQQWINSEYNTLGLKIITVNPSVDTDFINMFDFDYIYWSDSPQSFIVSSSSTSTSGSVLYDDDEIVTVSPSDTLRIIDYNALCGYALYSYWQETEEEEEPEDD